MKKIIGIILFVMMVIMISVASANEDPIWDDVCSWWKNDNKELYKAFIETDYSYKGFQYKDGTACYAYYGMYLGIPEGMTVAEAEKDLYNQMAASWEQFENLEVELNVIGWNQATNRYVMEVKVSSTTDMATVEGTGFEDFEDPVYKAIIVCYDKY